RSIPGPTAGTGGLQPDPAYSCRPSFGQRLPSQIRLLPVPNVRLVGLEHRRPDTTGGKPLSTVLVPGTNSVGMSGGVQEGFLFQVLQLVAVAHAPVSLTGYSAASLLEPLAVVDPEIGRAHV